MSKSEFYNNLCLKQAGSIGIENGNGEASSK